MGYASEYGRVLWPARQRVLGRWLEPFCLGHALLLNAVGSPFAGGEKQDGRVAGLGDLLLGLWICSRPVNAAAAGLGQRRTGRWLRRRGWLALVLDGLGWRLAREQARFAAYVGSAWRGPRVWLKGQHGAKAQAPVLQVLKLTLQAHLGLSEAQALGTPLQQALWDYFAYWESQGAVELVGEAEEELMAEAREARLKAQG